MSGPHGSNGGSVGSMNLSASTFREIHPVEFLGHFLEKGVRPDGRKIMEWRRMILNDGGKETGGMVNYHADGSALVSLGETIVISGIRCEVGQPAAMAPNDGRLEISVHFPALCSADPQRLQDRLAASLSGGIEEKLLGCQGAIALSELCIDEGKSCWVVYIDCVFLNDDGNAFDAAFLAASVALRSLQIPQLSAASMADARDAKADKLMIDPTLPPARLTMKRLPIPATFAL